MFRTKQFLPTLLLAGAALRALVPASAQSPAASEAKPAHPAKRIAIRAGHLIDGKSDKVLDNVLVLIDGESIVSVTPGGSPPAGVEAIDLSRSTVLPGFIDLHTHVLLNGDITPEDYDQQLLKESIPYRAILAARNARIALDHGFTTLRDLETEGAMYADVDVKTAIANGEVPGPRMQVSTRAMTPTGCIRCWAIPGNCRCPRACSMSMASMVPAKRFASRSCMGPTGSNITPIGATA